MLVLVKLKICLFQEKFLYIHYLVKNDNIPSSVEFQDLRQRRETKTNTFFLSNMLDYFNNRKTR